MKFNNLTRLDIRRLKSGQHIAEHGIRFDRLANGDGRYTVEIMVDRVRVHRVVGLESNGVTRTQAEELISRLRTEAREQRLKLPAGRKVALTFAQAAVHYLKRSEEVQGKNLKAKQQHLTQHLVPFFGKLPLSKIDAFGLKRYVKQRSEHIAASTINRELATLSNLLHRAIEWGWIEKAVKVPRLKENNGRMIYLTREQILRVLDAARADSCWEIHPFVLIGLHTGMRRMEILSMRWEHIDYEHCIIRIPEAKAGPRDQPMTVELAAYLAELRAMAPESPWVFPADSASGHRVAIEKPFRRVIEAAGLNSKEVTRHALRHTAITHLVQSGVDLPTVQRISGHKTLAMVGRYSHQNGAHLQTAMDRLQCAITQELHGKRKSPGE
ncbi:MAG TPA: site-specific integrase [Candidatus Competibacter sp.]|nr:site-specific integrase [Candidatus Competibacter sp.]